MTVLGEISDPEVQGNIYRAGLAIPANRGWSGPARLCQDFVEGRQWDERERAVRDEQKRPTLTFNRIRPLRRLVYGWFCQQKLDIVFRPGNDANVSDDVAEVLSKLVKNIHLHNDFEWLETECFLDGLDTGRGWLDARLDFSRNFMGELRLSTRDPFHTFPDPEGSSYDPQEWGYVVESRWVSLDDVLVYYGKMARKKVEVIADMQFQARYHDALWAESEVDPQTHFGLMHALQRAEDKAPHMWSCGPYGSGSTSLDLLDPARKLVRVIDCQWRELKRRRWFCDLETGEESLVPDKMPREKVVALLQLANSVYQQSGIGTPVVMVEGQRPVWNWTVTAGDQLLYHAPSIYEAPTQVLFSPYFRRGVTHGMVHDLIDPQIEVNKRRSALVEIQGRIANGGWMIEEGSMDEQEEVNLQRHSSTPGVFVKYKQGMQPPQPIVPPPLPAAHGELEAQAREDLKEIATISDAMLGQVDSPDQSGRALLTLQKGGLTALQSYVDQIRRTLLILGRREQAIIRRAYTEQRIFRERGEDGTDIAHVINLRLADGTIVNDVTSGTYDVTVDCTPFHATMEQATFETMQELSAAMPGAIPPGYLVKNAPIPASDKAGILDSMQQQAQMAAMAGMGLGAGQPPPLPKGGKGANIPPGQGAPGAALGG